MKVMQFFFVPDHRGRFRFISTEPVHEIQVKFSRWRKIWEEARRRLMLLPARTLRQEQAFEAVLRQLPPQIEIVHPAELSEKKIRRKFFFFLQRQRSRHVALLVGETILLPISGLMALLPGPNIFFGFLALIMYTHWQGLRGINHLGRKVHSFHPSSLFQEWTRTLEADSETARLDVLARIEREFELPNLRKVLYK